MRPSRQPNRGAGMKSFEAARLCQHNALYADAISRAYYAVMHAAKAALELYDVTVHSHAGVRSLFGRYFIGTGLVEREWSAELGQLVELRTSSDYDSLAVFTEMDARIVCERAELFINRIRALLDDVFPHEGLPG